MNFLNKFAAYNPFVEKLDIYPAETIKEMSKTVRNALQEKQSISSADIDKWVKILGAAEEALKGITEDGFLFETWFSKTLLDLSDVSMIKTKLEAAPAVRTLIFAYKGDQAKDQLKDTLEGLASPFREDSDSIGKGKLAGYSEEDLRQMFENISMALTKVKSDYSDEAMITACAKIISAADGKLWHLSNSKILLEGYLSKAFIALKDEPKIKAALDNSPGVRFLMYAFAGDKAEVRNVIDNDGDDSDYLDEDDLTNNNNNNENVFSSPSSKLGTPNQSRSVNRLQNDHVTFNNMSGLTSPFNRKGQAIFGKASSESETIIPMWKEVARIGVTVAELKRQLPGDLANTFSPVLDRLQLLEQQLLLIQNGQGTVSQRLAELEKSLRDISAELRQGLESLSKSVKAELEGTNKTVGDLSNLVSALSLSDQSLTQSVDATKEGFEKLESSVSQTMGKLNATFEAYSKAIEKQEKSTKEREEIYLADVSATKQSLGALQQEVTTLSTEVRRLMQKKQEVVAQDGNNNNDNQIEVVEKGPSTEEIMKEIRTLQATIQSQNKALDKLKAPVETVNRLFNWRNLAIISLVGGIGGIFYVKSKQRSSFYN